MPDTDAKQTEIETQGQLGEWVSTARAAQLLGVTPRWIRELVKCGDLVGKLVHDRLMMIRLSSIEDYKQRKP